MEIIIKIKVGDWVKCISHKNKWSTRFTIGKIYYVKTINSGSDFNLYCSDTNCTLWVEREDFVLYEPECVEPIQDNSEWKIGDSIMYMSKEHSFNGFQDCTVSNIYKIIDTFKNGNFKFIDDVGNSCKIQQRERIVFQKIINNQTTELNYHDK